MHVPLTALDPRLLTSGVRDKYADRPDYLWPGWTLDGTGGHDTPAEAFLAGWRRLHPEAGTHCWRVEWVPHV